VIVNAWAVESGLSLGQRKGADKSNEITAVPQLLRVLELAGCIVTLDAMGCQKNIAKEIREADARLRAGPQRQPRHSVCRSQKLSG
jgi:predicted transposase YbfD/YdcC